jgi:hypothetical protein
MKKVKLMLAVVAICATVGGLFAFKSQKINDAFLCGISQTNCPTPKQGTETTGADFLDSWCTYATGTTTNCPLRITTEE